MSVKLLTRIAPTCSGCRERTHDYVTTFTADKRRLNFCQENGCAERWLKR